MKKSMIFGTLAIMAMTAAGAGIAGAHNPYHDGYRSGYHHTYEYGHGNYGCDGYRTPHMFRGRNNAYYNDNYQENILKLMLFLPPKLSSIAVFSSTTETASSSNLYHFLSCDVLANA